MFTFLFFCFPLLFLLFFMDSVAFFYPLLSQTFLFLFLEEFIELLSTIKSSFSEVSVQVSMSSSMSTLLIIYVSVRPRYSPNLISCIVMTPFLFKLLTFLTPLNLFLFCSVSIFFSSYFHHRCIWNEYLTKVNLWNVCLVFLIFCLLL